MRHRNYPTRLSLAAMLMSSVYLVACGGSGEGETSAQEGPTETAESLAREGETSAQETSAQEGSTEMAERLSSYTWSKVADQGQTFTLASWTWVRYGSGKNWVYKRVSGTVSCTNEFFGNPAPGVRKACYAIVATPDPAPPPPPAPPAPPPPPPPPPPSCPCSAWSASTTPTTPQHSDPNAVELGVKFTTSIDGFISGVRFYKATGNTGTHVGNLWSASGALLARATFSAETASGWQQVNFASPVPVNANTVYVASYYAPNGNYAADLNFFATSGVSNGPVNLLSNGAAGGNSVYRYSSTTTFPSSTYNATNYWVDLVFSATGTAPPPPPPAPTGTAALSWTASPDANVTGYRVYYGTAPGAYSQPRGSGLTTGNATSWTVSGLNPGTLYYFAVTALDSAGKESVYSNEASKQMP